ncbi:hypothetical protein [Phenylobacterium sp.]|jgi:hypothetical protein|uniref:terminase small subunit-like protein n=1 Tax=Phenylobacterium sp. TaxID=1871053 RepID=UPI002E357DE7|nr:hypothetical protein [Phenylobacterium sp.]HEX3367212.1 hypothetical protein [Phenylobacterium sp.]
MADGAVGRPAGASAGEVVFFSEELGRTICARVAAGETLASVCRSPGMPHRLTATNWRRHPEFGAAMAAALLAARTARRVEERAVAAAWMARPKRPGGRRPVYTPELGEAICQRLSDGESLLAITRGPAMPGAPTIFRWVRQYPEFEAMYVTARQEQADYLLDEAREVALAATPKSVWADRLRFDTIRWMTARLAPKKYCKPILLVREAAQIRAEEAEAKRDRLAENEGGGMTVIVKRFCDVTPEDEAEADATERAYERRALGRRT